MVKGIIAIIVIDAVFLILFLKYSHLANIKRFGEGRKQV